MSTQGNAASASAWPMPDRRAFVGWKLPLPLPSKGKSVVDDDENLDRKSVV
jgi:hypothetical protein